MITFFKKITKAQNHLIVPRQWVRKYGYNVYMKVDYNTGVIIVTPAPTGSKEEAEGITRREK